MNVRCPSCDTLYRVDPAKVPKQGIKARCAECPAVISVVHPIRDESALQPLPTPAATVETIQSPPETQIAIESQEPAFDIPPLDLDVEPQEPPTPQAVVEEVTAEELAIEEIPPLYDEQIVVEPEVDFPVSPMAVEPEPLVLDAPPPTDAMDTPSAGVYEDAAQLIDEEIVSYSESVLEPPPETEAEDAVEPSEIILDEIPPLPDVPSEPAAAIEAEPVLDELPPLPDLPEVAEPESPADIEIRAPEAEKLELRPPLEVIPPSGDAPREGGRRYTRPFMKPPETLEAPPAPSRPGPVRPTAPVFRPTPGMPVQTPPKPDRQPPVETPPEAPAPPSAVTPTAELPTEMATPAPVEAPDPTATPAPIAEPELKPKRPVNPFLSKDPKQKARRLARALVSDMIVYQPQKRQDALAAGTLKEDFDEEIKKSWEEYVEQVGEELANSTDFFKEALNDILAGGNKVF